MPMKIIKAAEAIPVEHPVFCWFGQPGIGKSSLGYSTKDPLLLDFDAGAHRAANRRDTLVIGTWADVSELMATKAALEPYSTIVVDTVGRCLDLMSADIIDQTPKYGKDGSLTLQGFGVLKGRFRTWMTQLRTLGKDVALVAHHREEKDGDVTVMRPDITGGSYGEVMKIADFVAFVYMRGKDRVMDFNPTDRWVGKNPAGWKPLLVPAIAQAQDFMAGLVEQGRTALGQISVASATIAQQVEDWRLAVAGYTTPDEVNRAIAEVGTMSAILAPQARKILGDQAKALGFIWSVPLKAYTAPKPEPVGATA